MLIRSIAMHVQYVISQRVICATGGEQRGTVPKELCRLAPLALEDPAIHCVVSECNRASTDCGTRETTQDIKYVRIGANTRDVPRGIVRPGDTVSTGRI